MLQKEVEKLAETPHHEGPRKKGRFRIGEQRGVRREQKRLGTALGSVNRPVPRQLTRKTEGGGFDLGKVKVKWVRCRATKEG